LEKLWHRKGEKWLSKRLQLEAYKAEVIIVDPSNTTQRCFNCDLIPEKRIELDVRF
jgi:transposase